MPAAAPDFTAPDGALDRNPNVDRRQRRGRLGWLARAATDDPALPSPDGEWTTQQRETYDRGNGATILLYDLDARTVVLTRQFRFPVYVNDHPDGMFIEAAAGLLDGDSPEVAIAREATEELGITPERVVTCSTSI